MLNPCRPCCCSYTPCEHCLFGYQTEEYKHNLMKDNIRRYLSGDENFVGISSAKCYIEKHPNWEKEMEDEETVKKDNETNLFYQQLEEQSKDNTVIGPDAHDKQVEPDYKTLFENLQDTCEDYRTKIRHLTAKLEEAEKELDKLRVLKKSLEALTGRTIEL